MAELSKGGRGARAATSSRRTRSWASARGQVSAGREAMDERISACTSSSGWSSWPSSRVMEAAPRSAAPGRPRELGHPGEVKRVAPCHVHRDHLRQLVRMRRKEGLLEPFEAGGDGLDQEEAL